MRTSWLSRRRTATGPDARWRAADKCVALVLVPVRALLQVTTRLWSELAPTAGTAFSDICEVDSQVFSYTAWYDLQHTARWSAQGCVEGGWHCLDGFIGAQDRSMRGAELEAAVRYAVVTAIRQRLASVPAQALTPERRTEQWSSMST